MQDGDSNGNTNSNPNLLKNDLPGRNLRDPRNSAAPGRLINKVTNDTRR